MGLNRNADEVRGMSLGDEDRSEAVTDVNEVVGDSARQAEPAPQSSTADEGDGGFDGGAPQSAADVTDAGREAERRTLDDETDRLGGEDSRSDF